LGARIDNPEGRTRDLTRKLSPELTVERARALALEAGFNEVGLVALPYEAEARDAERFREFVAAGRAGTMGYLKRKAGDGRLLRERAAVPFPWARSAVVCFASYAAPTAPLSTKESKRGSAWIARYAWTSRVLPSRLLAGKKDEQGRRVPSDYHKVLLKRLRAVESALHAELGEFESRAYVDTGPIVERALAVAAGLGWMGKNTCLIHPKLGSFGFLAALLTSLEVSKSSPALAKLGRGTHEIGESASRRVALEVPDRCGSCARCIEACPTNALDVPYQMDATRCIAYLTIEYKGEIAGELAGKMGRQVFGCDICQDVCPWNGKAIRDASNASRPTHSAGSQEADPSASLRTEWMGHNPIAVSAELEPREELINPALEWLASMDEAAFEREFNGSPVRRTGFNGLRRNLAIAMGNSGLGEFVPRLERWTAEADEGLRAAARWALTRLRGDGARQE